MCCELVQQEKEAQYLLEKEKMGIAMQPRKVEGMQYPAPAQDRWVISGYD